MNMRIILKMLLIFWGIVLAGMLVKSLTSIKIEKFDFNFLQKNTQVKNNDTTTYFPLQKRYGLKLQGYEGCVKDYTAGKYERGFSYSTSSMCMNGECELNVEFQEKIPKKIKLYIKSVNDCSLKEFEVPKTLDAIGYFINLQLSTKQKAKLGIHAGDQIRVEHANGYSLSGNKQFYFYDTPIDKDNIVVNDTIVGEVFFNKNASHTQTTQVHKEEAKKEVEIDIPHPKELYTFTCDANMLCQKEANTYIVNVDGVDFIPSKAFILTCLADKHANNFCTFFIPLGHTESMKFDSKSLMNSYMNMSKNPEFNDSFQTWEQKRLEKAKQKIENSLL